MPSIQHFLSDSEDIQQSCRREKGNAYNIRVLLPTACPSVSPQGHLIPVKDVLGHGAPVDTKPDQHWTMYTMKACSPHGCIFGHKTRIDMTIIGPQQRSWNAAGESNRGTSLEYFTLHRTYIADGRLAFAVQRSKLWTTMRRAVQLQVRGMITLVSGSGHSIVSLNYSNFQRDLGTSL